MSPRRASNRSRQVLSNVLISPDCSLSQDVRRQHNLLTNQGGRMTWQDRTSAPQPTTTSVNLTHIEGITRNVLKPSIIHHVPCTRPEDLIFSMQGGTSGEIRPTDTPETIEPASYKFASAWPPLSLINFPFSFSFSLVFHYPYLLLSLFLLQKTKHHVHHPILHCRSFNLGLCHHAR